MYRCLDGPDSCCCRCESGWKGCALPGLALSHARRVSSSTGHLSADAAGAGDDDEAEPNGHMVRTFRCCLMGGWRDAPVTSRAETSKNRVTVGQKKAPEYGSRASPRSHFFIRDLSQTHSNSSLKSCMLPNSEPPSAKLATVKSSSSTRIALSVPEATVKTPLLELRIGTVRHSFPRTFIYRTPIRCSCNHPLASNVASSPSTISGKQGAH